MYLECVRQALFVSRAGAERDFAALGVRAEFPPSCNLFCGPGIVNSVARRQGLEAEPIPDQINTERELITRILEGERRLFHDLVRPYERAVYLTTFSMLRNHADAEEAAQEAMIKAFTHLAQLKELHKFKQWLLRIAANEARIKWRSKHVSLFEPLETNEHQDTGFMPRNLADWREDPSEIMERQEVREKVALALKGLPEIYREIFVLRDVEQLSVHDCAEIVGISEQLVKVRLHRARLMMRERLAPVFKKPWFNRILPGKGRKPW